jgi:hypothetical protein
MLTWGRAVSARSPTEKAMKRARQFAIALALIWLALIGVLFLPTGLTYACGGLFCSSTPVDQNAERIIFKVRDDGKTDMIVQISYQGKAEDFAWILPLGEPPSEQDLGVFPQAALNALDSQTGPVVYAGCALAASGGGFADAGSAPNEAERGVEVYVRAQIGNYEVVVIGSPDSQASVDWLNDEGFRISDAMQGFIELYTKEGMKFLALKLLPDKDVNDITPFKLTLPGETPSIPLRLSAIAAEPEMGIVVWIFGAQRYEPANVEELKIDDADLRFDSNGRSNWLTLVASAVDAAEGRGWVVENAQPVDSFRSFVMSSFTNTEEQQKAQQALLGVLEGTSYMTRLYTRLSPEEMTYDPLFKRSSKGDVDRFHSVTQNNECVQPQPPDPCAFTACGSLGLCRTLADKSAACACAPEATARTTFVPSLTGQVTTTVSCVDKRLSFLNPGDKNAAGEALPDPCVDVDCGGHGKCVPMNMTPTCECDRGYVAQGSVDAQGNRVTTCKMPSVAVPDNFYNRRAMPRDPSLPVGRDDVVPPPVAQSDPADPLPTGNATAMQPKPSGGSSCSMVRGDAARAGSSGLLLLATAALWLSRRRRA